MLAGSGGNQKPQPAAFIGLTAILNGAESKLDGILGRVFTLRESLFGPAPRDASAKDQTAQTTHSTAVADRIHKLIDKISEELDVISERV